MLLCITVESKRCEDKEAVRKPNARNDLSFVSECKFLNDEEQF